MRWFHPVTWCLIATSWVILVLLWQLHTERQKAKTAKAELRIYIGAASRYATEAMVAQGRLNACVASEGAY